MEMMENIIAFIESRLDPAQCEQRRVYPKSIHTAEGGHVAFLYRGEEEDLLVASGGWGFEGTEFTADGAAWAVCPANHANACLLRKYFPFTAPVPVLRRARTVGVGDRLGIATPGHIRVFQTYDAYPIFAQQSIRELNLTNRSYEQVLDSVTFAVFREDFQRGFGADGDHLKKPEEIQYALDCGYTMITLDCSEHIRNDVNGMSDEEVARQYVPDPALEAQYVGKTFQVGPHAIHFEAGPFRRMCLIYQDAIAFAASIYQQFIAGKEDAVDFEISIDETATPTEPAQHFFVARELAARGVHPVTLAPRFVGEFQKGIDYIGDLAAFEADFAVHAAIAEHFGYKISVHSGSDKFSVFPTVGKYTRGNFHLKTAGTSWLEAMTIVAEHAPALYREIHDFALSGAFEEARKYYHVTTNLDNIPDLKELSDAQLPALLEKNNDARQLIHITYGLILNAVDADGADRFRTRLYHVWRQYAGEYAARLERHIGRHLELLYRGASQAAV